MTDGVSEVEAVLARLPVLEDRRDAVATEADSIRLVHALYITREVPNAQAGGATKAERELAELHDALLRVAHRLHGLPKEAHDALGQARDDIAARRQENEASGIFDLSDRCPQPSKFRVAATVLAEAAEAAQARVSAGDGGKGGGRPMKKAAPAVARQARRSYETLTGERATVITRHGRAEGPFIAFLGDLFDALGIEASPETQARAATKGGPAAIRR